MVSVVCTKGGNPGML